MIKKSIGFIICGLMFIGCMDQSEEPISTTSSELTSFSSLVETPSHTSATATATECSNAPGPFVTLDGELKLGTLSLRLVFRNNQKGTHERVGDVASVDVVLIPAGESIVLPKQPSSGGVGGNPFIWFQLVDGDGNALTSEVLLGRCVQGLSPVSLDFGAPGLADMSVLSVQCTNSPGPVIEVEGSVSMREVKARLIFRNSLTGPHEYVKTVDLTVYTDGLTYSFPKQPVHGGVGGNPLIYAQFVDSSGQALTSEVLLGRCVQLSK